MNENSSTIIHALDQDELKYIDTFRSSIFSYNDSEDDDDSSLKNIAQPLLCIISLYDSNKILNLNHLNRVGSNAHPLFLKAIGIFLKRIADRFSKIVDIIYPLNESIIDNNDDWNPLDESTIDNNDDWNQLKTLLFLYEQIFRCKLFANDIYLQGIASTDFTYALLKLMISLITPIYEFIDKKESEEQKVKFLSCQLS